MSTYLNTGVRWAKTGERIPTKKALKEAIQIGPDLIEFDSTSELDTTEPVFVLGDLTPDVVFSVTGPDPYTDRIWYAQIRLDKNGKVKVT